MPRVRASAITLASARAITTELNGEKIDIVDYDDDPAACRRVLSLHR